VADLPGRPGPVAGLWQWRHRGACRDADPELFFPPDVERGPARQRRQQSAVAVCAGCPVRAQCRGARWRCPSPTASGAGLSETARDAILGRPGVLTEPVRR